MSDSNDPLLLPIFLLLQPSNEGSLRHYLEGIKTEAEAMTPGRQDLDFFILPYTSSA